MDQPKFMEIPSQNIHDRSNSNLQIEKTSGPSLELSTPYLPMIEPNLANEIQNTQVPSKVGKPQYGNFLTKPLPHRSFITNENRARVIKNLDSNSILFLETFP